MQLTIGILSWGAHETLRNTLNSYIDRGLLETDADIIIFFQQMSEQDEIIAKYFGIDYFGSPYNLGIAEGYRRLVERSTSDFFLFLENDWLLLEDPHIQLGQGRYLLRDGVDLVRYRHREQPGAPLWTRQFEGDETQRLTHLLDCVHWIDEPDAKFPAYIKRKVMHSLSIDTPKLEDFESLGHPNINDDNWYLASSKHANWTNNPHMARTDFLRESILPRIQGGNLEQDLQSWWEQQDFTVAQGSGLFKHWRLD